MAKLFYLPAEATVRYSSAFNPAIGDSREVWNVRDFIADATMFIPPKVVRLIHYFGLYASRSPPLPPSLSPPAVQHGRD